MTDLQHLQKVILMIASDFDAFCKQNDIRYFLLGGSAIGAIRHHGFIPWDDDLDVGMDSENYNKFLSLCRKELDTEKYYIKQGYVDWPMPYSKILLKGTVFTEPGKINEDKYENGIFLDVFKLENASDYKIGHLWQYTCAKYLLCYCLLERGWSEITGWKKILMLMAYPVKINAIRKFLIKQTECWSNKNTKCCSFLAGRYRYKKAFYKKELFEDVIYVPFEDTKLPVPVGYDAWLKQIFGDYMTPPPAREQVGLHLQGVDFGKY